MSEELEQELEYADYDFEEDFDAVPATEALPYPEAPNQDVPVETEETGRLGFTAPTGVSTKEAIARARLWSNQGWYFGTGQCLATVRKYWNVNSKYPTASASWSAANTKRYVAPHDVPRGAPVWWTGGSSGAGHVAISVGGGYCLSTDWKRAGKIDYAKISDITSHWNLDYKGYTREINDVTVWKPRSPVGIVRLKNLKPGSRHADVKKVKQRLHQKGYKGFLLSSNKFGSGLRRAYGKYQHRLGYEGTAANGVPGRTSLKKLGFRVI